MKTHKKLIIPKRKVSFERTINMFCKGEQKKKVSLVAVKRFMRINQLIVDPSSFLLYIMHHKGLKNATR